MCVAGEDGFAVYRCDPFHEVFSRSLGGGVAHAEMLFQCQLLGLVGGGKRPFAPPGTLTVWDDARRAPAGEVSQRSPIRAVRMHRTLVAVATEYHVTAYALEDMRPVLELDTAHCPRALLALSLSDGGGEGAVLACAGLRAGQASLTALSAAPGGTGPRARTRFITAHRSGLGALALTVDGARLATASERGTLVRVFDCASGECLAELRRGTEPAAIHSLTFSRTGTWLALSSSTLTVHVFDVDRCRDEAAAAAAAAGGAAARPGPSAAAGAPEGQPPPPPPQFPPQSSSPLTSALGVGRKVWGKIKPALPSYFRSRWSTVSFKVPGEQLSDSEVAFDHSLGDHGDPCVQVATARGEYLRFSITGRGAVLQTHRRFAERRGAGAD